MYHIEILSTNEELYTFIEKAYTTLNQIQSDFEFDLPSETLRKELFIQRRDDYFSEDIYTWLDDYKKKAKGYRPFIILVVEGSLRTNRYANLFGTTRAESGYAVFTVKDFNQFVNDKIRFIRYYLVRYAIGFIEPSLKSHNEEERKDCIFHRKIKKMELLNSLNSGKICSICEDILRPKLTDEIKGSLIKLLKVVSDQHPYALVVKGGGIKGIAFAGALLELEQYFSFDTFAGTSAGAIIAVLLGAGYQPKELLHFLNSKDFNEFKDASFFSAIINFIKTRGLYPGNEIEKWLDELIAKQFPEKIGQIKLRDYEYHTIVYSSRINNGRLVFDSKNERKDAHASFAARCSMSIPYFFSPKSVDGIRVYDGGLRLNFPLKTFTESYPQKLVIGLFLMSDSKKGGLVIGEITNIAIEGEEAEIVNNNRDKVVIIDPRPIKTTDFNLTKEKKEFLLLAGQLGALEFIVLNHPSVEDIKIVKERIPIIEEQIKELKKKI